MRITLAELRGATKTLFDHLEATGQTSIEIADDYYWLVPRDQRHDPYAQPTKLTLGQLSDDWYELTQIRSGERAPTGPALTWLASVLRWIGEHTTG